MIKIVGILFGALALGAAVAVAIVMGIIPLPVGPAAEARAALEKAKPPVTVMFPTKERIVNLTDKSATRYLKVQATLEFLDHKLKEAPKGAAVKAQQEEFAADIEPHQAIIDDTLNTILSSKTSQDLFKPNGKEALKSELKEAINHALHDREEVVNVYFTTFIIQ